MLALLGVLFLAYSAEAQYKSCANGGLGPFLTNGENNSACVVGACPSPTTQTCIQTGPGTEVCCENSLIIEATTTTTAAPCEDKVNPTTKVSDCARVAYLCNDALYYRLMTEQCPKTCNRCPGASVTTTMAPTPAPVTTSCRDLVNPRTGVSNCATVAYLCNNPYYYQLMTQQCPRTCNRCPSTVAPISTTCRDLVDPRTGVSNCPSVSNLCRDTNYYNLMKQQCPKTCGYCT